jgi:hypothetical protein
MSITVRKGSMTNPSRNDASVNQQERWRSTIRALLAKANDKAVTPAESRAYKAKARALEKKYNIKPVPKPRPRPAPAGSGFTIIINGEVIDLTRSGSVTFADGSSLHISVSRERA